MFYEFMLKYYLKIILFYVGIIILPSEKLSNEMILTLLLCYIMPEVLIFLYNNSNNKENFGCYKSCSYKNLDGTCNEFTEICI